MAIEEALRAQVLREEEFSRIWNALTSFVGAGEEAYFFYTNKVLTWLPGMDDGVIEFFVPLVKEKLGIPRESLFRDIRQRRKETPSPENGQAKQKSQRPAYWPDRKIHPALDFDLESGFVSVGVLRPEGYGLVTHHQQVGAKWHPIDSVSDFVGVKHFEYSAFMGKWPEGDLQSFLLIQNTPAFAEAFALLVDLIQTHLDMDEKYIVFEATYIIGTYFFLIFSTYPRQHLNGEPGSGKTKMQNVIAGTAFNGLLRINPTLASLFRIIQVYRPTLCLDEMDALTGDYRKELLGFLNSGYQRGGAIDRCEGEERKVVNYEIYSPVSLSGIRGVNPTTAERCIYVPMQRGCDRAKLNTEISRDETQMAKIRSLCYRLSLMRVPDVVRTLGSLDLPDWLNGRDRELWRPLLAIAALVDVEGGLDATKDLLALAETAAKEREGLSLEAQETIAIIEQRLTGEWIEIRPVEIAPLLEERLRLKEKDITPQKVGYILKRLGFTKLPRDREGARYRIEKTRLDDIKKRYGCVGA